MSRAHVSGIKKGDILLYALSTCVWCNKTKNLLNSLGIEYNYINVDQLDEEEKLEVLSEIEKWNPVSFPTIVINNKKCIKGFDEEAIRETLDL